MKWRLKNGMENGMQNGMGNGMENGEEHREWRTENYVIRFKQPNLIRVLLALNSHTLITLIVFILLSEIRVHALIMPCPCLAHALPCPAMPCPCPAHALPMPYPRPARAPPMRALPTPCPIRSSFVYFQLK